MNILELYLTNDDVKSYIDKYATSNQICVNDAMEHKMVKLYVEWMSEKGLL